MQRIEPVNDKVVVERAEGEKSSKGGILLPDTAQKKSQVCVVLAVGPGRLLDDGTRVALPCKAGDRVLIRLYGGSEATLGDKEYVVVNEDDILGVVRGGLSRAERRPTHRGVRTVWPIVAYQPDAVPAGGGGGVLPRRNGEAD